MHRFFTAARLLSAVGAAALAMAAPPALADTDYTDHWQDPAQKGWGIALTQGTDKIYAEIFHYNSSHQPTWFGGTIYRLADGHYAGTLYTIAGDYYGHFPYDPTLFIATTAGTMDFQASDPSHAQFSFTINGVTVTTAIERLTLDGLSLSGAYLGAFVQNLSSDCTGGAGPIVHYTLSEIVVGQTSVPGGTVTIRFLDTSAQGNLYYMMQGAATQFGKVVDIPSAAYSNPGSTFTPLHVYDLRRTANGGIEGRWKTISGTSDKCVDEGRFSGVAQ
ncbi:MAG TPA: hypothetical protein VN789_01010 [Casimicrobiaceae bacterium]|jgi:hypothetical protein|nr:hypothetical protein [Casimicrobiaceae bacterium]